MQVLLVGTNKMMVVKMGKSIDPAFSPYWALALFVPDTFTLVLFK